MGKCLWCGYRIPRDRMFCKSLQACTTRLKRQLAQGNPVAPGGVELQALIERRNQKALRNA